MDIAVHDEVEDPDATYAIASDVMVTTIQEDSITPYTAAKEGEDKKIAQNTEHYIKPLPSPLGGRGPGGLGPQRQRLRPVAI